MKIGIVCEGQRGCCETQVLPHLIKLICPSADHDIVPSGNRPNVIKQAPAIAKRLLNEGCVAVFIMWDVFPGWRDSGQVADCRPQLAELIKNLQAANVDLDKIVPIAVHEELEAWLLCDGDALNSVIGPLQSPRRRIGHERNPCDVKDPKVALQNLFALGRGRRYNEAFSAGQIASRLRSKDRLRRSQSFKRFDDRLSEFCKRHCH